MKEYALFFGYEGFEDEFEPYSDEKIKDVVNEYCGEEATDDIVDIYWKMGESNE